MANNQVEINENSNIIKPCSKKTGPRNFKCSFAGCSLSYSRKWKLDRHLCSHTGARPFKCESAGCNKAYQSSSHLQRHVRSSHLKTELLPCTFHSCKASFKNKSSLMNHIKNHCRSVKFQCSYCSKVFASQIKLTRHELEHKGVYPFPCQLCQNQWASLSKLKRHNRLVHGAFPCSYQGCTTTVDSKKNLRQHLSLEHRTYYTCDFCKKNFNNKGVLRDHILIHLPFGTRSVFTCPHSPCKRVYYQKRNLQHHLKVFHRAPRFYCTETDCDYTSINEAALKRHGFSKHKVRREEDKEEIIEKLANIEPLDDLNTLEPTPCSNPQFTFRVILRDHI